jgi:hypothetical protein
MGYCGVGVSFQFNVPSVGFAQFILDYCGKRIAFSPCFAFVPGVSAKFGGGADEGHTNTF